MVFACGVVFKVNLLHKGKVSILLYERDPCYELREGSGPTFEIEKLMSLINWSQTKPFPEFKCVQMSHLTHFEFFHKFGYTDIDFAIKSWRFCLKVSSGTGNLFIFLPWSRRGTFKLSNMQVKNHPIWKGKNWFCVLQAAQLGLNFCQKAEFGLIFGLKVCNE